MSPLSLPDPLVDQKPWEDERTGVQRNFDRIAQQFPLGTQHLQDDAVTQAKIADDAVGTDQIAALPKVNAYRSTAQATTSAAGLTAITFDSERYDSHAQHSTSSNTSRLTCTVAGLYAITGMFAFDANAVGYREAALKLNGTSLIAYDSRPPATGPGTGFVLTRQFQLAVNDYVELCANQTSGGSLNVIGAADHLPELMWHWVGP